jgi:hypothetical protein
MLPPDSRVRLAAVRLERFPAMEPPDSMTTSPSMAMLKLSPALVVRLPPSAIIKSPAPEMTSPFAMSCVEEITQVPFKSPESHVNAKEVPGSTMQAARTIAPTLQKYRLLTSFDVIVIVYNPLKVIRFLVVLQNI